MRNCRFFIILLLVLLVPTVASASSTPEQKLSSHIESFLEDKNSPLANYSGEFVKWGMHYGVDPRFLVAISGGETSFATDPAAAPASTVGHNAWGIGPGWHFKSWPHGIKSAAELLGTYYRHKVYIREVREKWAPSNASNDPTGLNENWVGAVSHFYAELGGDPNKTVFMVPGTLRLSAQKSLAVKSRQSAFVDPLDISIGTKPKATTKSSEAFSVEVPRQVIGALLGLAGIGVLAVYWRTRRNRKAVHVVHPYYQRRF